MQEASTHLKISSEIGLKDLTAIRGALRIAFIRSEYRAKFMEKHRVIVPRYTSTGKLHKKPWVKYKCEECNELFPDKDINVDHVDQVGSFLSAIAIKEFFFSMWCLLSNLQILCYQCHDGKTAEEKRAKTTRKKNNDKRERELNKMLKDTIVTATGEKLCGLPVFMSSILEPQEITLSITKKGAEQYRYLNLDDISCSPSAYIQNQIFKLSSSSDTVIKGIHCASIEDLGFSLDYIPAKEYSERTEIKRDLISSLDDLI